MPVLDGHAMGGEPMVDAADFLVNQKDYADTRWVERPTASIADGEVLLKVDAFALTANNVTYAAYASVARYWDFFPAEGGFGRVPVWGFATVVASRCAGVDVGTKYYGYYAPSTDIVMQPVEVNERRFIDGAAHRRDLPPIYNEYVSTQADPAYDPSYEGIQMLFRPLFATGWLLDQTVAAQTPSPTQVVVTSASSKTAMTYAHLAGARSGVRVIGLTSESNRDFVERSGLYAEVLSYDAVNTLASDEAAVAIDFRGQGELRQAIAARLGSSLSKFLRVGATDWQSKSSQEVPLPQEEWFFAPSVAQMCAQQMGPAAFLKKMLADTRAFYSRAEGLVKVNEAPARAGLTAAWSEALAGSIAPDDGRILRFT
ncbi:MAG: DUF2855 family protein [Myxococcota bacterium]